MESTIGASSDTELGGPATVPDNRLPTELQPGNMVGDYRIEGVLGSGGMGQVYASVHPVIGKRAAIKVLRAELSVNREAVERFVQEARAVNQIGHPNIVDVFAFGALPDGRSYFVMEWLKGESLRHRMKRDRMTIAEVAHVVDSVCIALEAAHEKGIVHRDLKPDNVFLVAVRSARPMVKLLDFGIAKLMGTEDTRLERTRTGNLLGTPAYIAPEQARGETIDQRVDVYSLGAMAYEMLAREVPFPARSAMDMVAQHLYTEPPSLRKRLPDAPAELDGLISRMMAKAPEARPSLDEIRSVMARCAEGGEAPTAAGKGRRAAPALDASTMPSGSIEHAETMISVTGAVPAQPAEEPRRRTVWLLPVLFLAAAGLAAAVVLATRGGDSAEGETPAQPAAAPAPDAAPIVTPDAAVAEVATPDAAVSAPDAGVKKKRDRDRKRDKKKVDETKKPPPPPDDDDAPMDPQ
jgi:serine/threonine-protein kinase